MQQVSFFQRRVTPLNLVLVTALSACSAQDGEPVDTQADALAVPRPRDSAARHHPPAAPTPIAYNSYTINAAISQPSESFAAKLASLTKTTLGASRTITFTKQPDNTPIPAQFSHGHDTDVLDAVNAGAAAGGLDAAYITGLHFNGTWGFLYTSAVPFGPTLDEYLGFLYAPTSASGSPTGLELLQRTVDKRGGNFVVVPIVANSEQGSGYFPKPLGDVHIDRCPRGKATCRREEREHLDLDGIGLEGLCSEHWTLRYVEPAMSVIGRSCDALERLGRIEKNNLGFVVPIPGQGVFAALLAGQIQGFEVATPMDDVSSLFAKPGVNPGTLGPRFIHYPGWHQQWLVSYMIVNRQLWDSWDDAQHALVQTMGRENMLTSYAETLQQQGDRLQQILLANRDDNDPSNDMVLSRWPERDLKFMQDQTIVYLNEHGRDTRLPGVDRQDYREMLSALRRYVSHNSAYWRIREVDLRLRFDDWNDDDSGEPWRQILR
jgi:TRAP-type mannitol/chloroaromatic compound transport system substrate-binding protein